MSIINDILEKRKIENIDDIKNPSSKHLIKDKFINQDKAVSIILDTIRNGENFSIYYDVDTDGITAGTIMLKYLANFTDNINICINEGRKHDISKDNIDLEWTNTLIIVDSLLGNYQEYYDIVSNNIRIIILDHHEVIQQINDENIVLVSSNVNYANPYLSGAGVVYKLCCYMDEYLMEKLSDELIDLAAIGIVGDISDMSNNSLENRYIVHRGFMNLKNKAIITILDGHDFNSTNILFKISPLINAAARMGKTYLAVNLLLEDDIKEIKSILEDIYIVKKIQDENVDYYFNELKPEIDNSKNFVYVEIPMRNITGLIATKINDYSGKPSIVVVKQDDCYSGSIRDNNSINFKDIINEFNEGAYAIGHQEAAGIYIDIDFKEDFLSLLDKELDNYDIKDKDNYYYDIELSLDEINFDIVKKIENINKLCGHNFETIKVKISNILINDYTVLKDKHLKISSNDIEFIIWNDCSILDKVRKDCDNYIDIIGELNVNIFFRKKNIQCVVNEVLDIKYVEYIN